MYDGNGNRYSKTITPSGGIASTRYYSYDTSGNIVSEYVQGASGPVPVVRYVRDRAGQVIEMIQGNRTYFYLYDGQDHITALTDESGSVVQTYSYDEYGNITNQTGTIYNPIIYTNYYWDSEVSLYHLKTRYYDPSIGRFLTRDKKGNEDQYESAQSSNFYIYAKNNPINMYDPTGKSAKRRVKAWADTVDVFGVLMNSMGFEAELTVHNNKILRATLIDNWWTAARNNAHGIYSYWTLHAKKFKMSKKKAFQYGDFINLPHDNYWGKYFRNRYSQTVKFNANKSTQHLKWKLDPKGSNYFWRKEPGLTQWVPITK